MTTALEGVPPGLVGVDLQAAAVHLLVDEELYPLPAIYGAAYIFIDRCYVFLDRPEPNRVRVVLTAKAAQVEPDALRALVGEFANELLSCAFRHQLAQDNRVLIETATLQALAG
ncbi:MAG TPA: His-Xaa-Ser system protein HxsD, partial [Nannocystis sp.]